MEANSTGLNPTKQLKDFGPLTQPLCPSVSPSERWNSTATFWVAVIIKWLNLFKTLGTVSVLGKHLGSPFFFLYYTKEATCLLMDPLTRQGTG